MTSFKKKLDEEIGEAPRFTKALQERIVHRTEQHHRHKQYGGWQYPTIIVGAIVTLLFLIAVGPWQRTEYVQHASIVELAQNEEIQQLSIVQNWDEDRINVGRIGWVIGQQEFTKGTETKLIENVLQNAVVAQKNDDYYGVSDVWVAFDNGQTVKVKMFKNKDKEQLAFLDIQTNTFYQVNDEQAVIEFTNFLFKEDPFNFTVFLLWIGVIILGAWITERAVRWKFNIPKEPKYVSVNHQRVVFTFKVINIIAITIFNLKGWIIYIAADFTLIITLTLINVATEYYFGRHEKRHYVAVTTTTYLLIVFTAFIIWVQ
ncbi:hypothetical protein [Lysinibacillus sp. JNUCC-52]|uniref:hypothetical protein n=1 Tax=Lysinibacillus sp. JNUCC-52 TaxID=2792480 RepID=UPI001934BF57|nr:hypothetical protein JNUCC52_19025 [Lysinibacillus sp. JNUCC-52]